MDLAHAHFLALKKLEATNESGIYNLGNGQGFSVKDVITVCKKITNKEIPLVIAPRRLGDPAVLIASSQKAQQQLGWIPQYTSLEEIILHAWNWHKANPNGFNN